VISLVGTKSKLVFKPLPQDDPRQRKPEISLAQSKLDWVPKVNLDDGLKATIDYFRRTLAE
jgi:UDP-glucuronate decarboxylase